MTLHAKLTDWRMLALQVLLQYRPTAAPTTAGEPEEARGLRLRARFRVRIVRAPIAEIRPAIVTLSREFICEPLHCRVAHE